MHFELSAFLVAVGFFGIIGIIFAETGLFFGFFLPGDSLLVTAGLLASQDIFSISGLLIFVPLAAILGDSLGYWTGSKIGKRVFSKKKSLLFNPKHIDRAHNFYIKHGKMTIVLAKFVPIVRTFAPIVAGVGKMEYKVFLRYSVLGVFLWTWGMLLLGYFLGNTIPNVEDYLFVIIFVIVVLSLLPPFIEHLRNKKH